MLFISSIVTGAHNEPIVGWIGNKNGPILTARAVRAGFINVLEADVNNYTLDLIPVDMTANGLLAAIWDYALNRYFILLKWLKRLISKQYFFIST